MGCDIHGVIEVRLTHRDEPGRGPQWFCVPPVYRRVNREICVSPVYRRVNRENGVAWLTYEDTAPTSFWNWRSRNYAMFAVLAGVRNYADVAPIAEPRGVPADASQEARDTSESWGVDGHSHSWATWREVASHPLAKEDFMRDLLYALRFAGDDNADDLPSDDVRLVFFFDN